MFLFSLRGSAGVKFAIVINFFILIFILSILNFSAAIFRLFTVIIFIAAISFSLVVLQRKKNKLQFVSKFNEELAFPRNKYVFTRAFAFNGLFVIFFFVPSVLIFIFSDDLSDAPAASLIFGLYLGCLSLVDIVQICLGRRKNDN